MQYREFGKFTLLDHMGKGGVASVYRANDNEAGNIVAIKVFEPSERRPADVVRKLRDRETRMLISVQHPNIVRYYESGNVSECYYYTMEFVENSLLKRMRHAEDLKVADKVNILRQTCNALQAIHHQGIVHRDIKPGNILLDEAPNGAIHVKVTDLGIAKHVSETDIVREEETSRRVPGTPKYLSPEQIQLKPVDGRADVFSLGVVSYELLAGEAPFKADTSEEYLRANLKQELRPIHHANPDIPAFISPVLDRMLAKDREVRYDSDTLAHDLELTYQHLVSGAPLVDEKNPESIYYVPPAPEAAAQAAVQEPASKAWQYGVAIGLVIFAAVIGFFAWPEMPESPGGSGPDFPGNPWGDTTEALDQADALFRAGQHWSCLAVLRALNTREMGAADVTRWDTLYRSVQDALAPAWGQKGLAALGDGHLTEAEIVRGMMREFFPNAKDTQDIEKAIEAQRSAIEKLEEWKDAMAALQGKVRGKQWRDAVSSAEKAIRELPAPDPEKEGQLRDIIVAAVNGYQKDILGAVPNAKKIDECLEFVAPHVTADWAQGKVQDQRPDLLLAKVNYYKKLNMVQDTLQAVKDVCDQYPDSEAAGKAAAIRDEILKNPNLLPPMEFEPFSLEIANNGLRAAVWTQNAGEGAKQEIQKVGDNTYVLVIQQTGGPGQRVTSFESVRPVRQAAGFDVRVKCMVKATQTERTEGYGAGLQITDKLGSVYMLWFDGTNYNLTYQKAGGSRGSFQRAPGVGTEDKAWHELRILYEYDLSRLQLFVDGNNVGEYPQVELGLFRIHLIAQISGEGECKAAFTDIRCDRPE